MFIRVYQKNREMLLNVNRISKIEVAYGIGGGGGNIWRVHLEESTEDPQTVRVYHVHIDGEEFLLQADVSNPVTKLIEQIFKDAVKG
jgi:hypothetical protein